MSYPVVILNLMEEIFFLDSGIAVIEKKIKETLKCTEWLWETQNSPVVGTQETPRILEAGIQGTEVTFDLKNKR